MSQLVINYFIKSLFFSFPHHYFHLVSYKLNPVIGMVCFSQAEKNIDLRKNVLLIYVVHVHMYAHTRQEITVYVYKYCSGPLCPPTYSESRFPFFLPVNWWTQSLSLGKSRKKVSAATRKKMGDLAVPSPPQEILIFKCATVFLDK